MSIESNIVYILDDDAAIRDALSVLVRSIALRAIECASADEFLQCFEPERGGCLVTDVYIPGMDGVALQKRLMQTGVHIPMIVMSGHGDIPLVVKMLRNGALDFIEKPFSNHHMLERILEALKLDAERRTQLQGIAEHQYHYDTLTPREKQVADYLVRGVSNKVIAADMDVSPRTIEAHRAHIFQKMKASSAVDLARIISSIRTDF